MHTYTYTYVHIHRYANTHTNTHINTKKPTQILRRVLELTFIRVLPELSYGCLKNNS